jgi:hypothetical protein
MRLRTAISVLVAVTALLYAMGCDVNREIYDFDDNAELRAYIHQEPRAKELFQTDSLFPADPYTKPGDSGAVYRDFVDSTLRNIYIEGEPEGDFREPYGVVPFAEVFVYDQFLIRTERTTSEGVDTVFEWRALDRAGFFLQLGNPQEHAFSGWVLTGFNGGGPRTGTMVAEHHDTLAFRLDGGDYKQYKYVRYVEKLIIDTLPGPDSTNQWIDTSKVVESMPFHTELYYVDLAEMSTPDPGDTIVIRAENMDGGVEGGTVYTLMTTETDSGWSTIRMDQPTVETYVDTLVVPASSSDQYHLVFFQERRRPDRYGSNWVVPYRYFR